MILLFLKGNTEPAKVELVNSKGKPFTNNEIYLKKTKVNFIGKINTFIFVVPHQRKTFYFVSSLDYHFSDIEGHLTLKEMLEW